MTLTTTPAKAAWQQALSQAIRSPTQLLEILGLDQALAINHQEFPMLVTQSFVARMRKGDPQDPLLRQVLPVAEEYLTQPGFGEDPVGETAYNPLPGLIHKYYGRVLLTATSHCAINCRYCFRRHFAYADNNPSRAQWQASFDYIAQDPTIIEVILSGGDPLLASDHYLAFLVNEVAKIPHVRLLRIHSRLPIVLPSRMTSNLIDLLSSTRLQTVLVMHCNHPQEISPEVVQAAVACKRAGIEILNQSVLLKNINDNVETLARLSLDLFAAQIKPYYLHVLDPVQGAAHFAINNNEIKALIRQLRARLPGYLVPLCVREEIGAPAKTPQQG